jgi:hypothetical protein
MRSVPAGRRHVSRLGSLLACLMLLLLVAAPATATVATTPDPTLLFEQLGIDIDGEAANDQSGYAVALSGDGKTLAIAAPYNDDNDSNAGHVRVYTWDVDTDTDTEAWVQQGGDIDGENGDDLSGRAVALSDNGKTLAIGAPYNDDNGSSAGHVRVYTWDVDPDTEVWVQQGGDINGEAANDRSGYAVALSGDGKTLAIGANGNGGSGSYAGHVRVYTWDVDPDTDAWVQQGGDIDGEAAYDQSGYAVALSGDGKTLAIGAPGNGGSDAGHVRVYTFDGDAWVQQGGDIDGEAANDQSGYAVALSGDGKTLAIGATGNDGNGSYAGHVRVYTFDGDAWVQLGDDINGEARYDRSGYAVALSGDGKTLAIGANGNDGNGRSAGHVRVYAWDVDGSAWVQQGGDIDGEAANDQSGYAVALSDNGKTLAIGANGNDGNGSYAGHVRVYVAGASPTLVGMPDDLMVEAAGPSGTPVDYVAPTATDTVDSDPVVSCDRASGSTFPIGVTTVECTATDDAGNSSVDTFDVTVTDTTAPTVVTRVDRSANDAGWHDGPVTISYTCFDTGSGVASCPEPTTVTADGADQLVTVTAYDNAGNEADATTVLSIDASAPVIIETLSAAPNEAGWHDAPVTIDYVCTDATSGIARCSEPVSVTTDGADQRVTGWAVDVAGNAASVTRLVHLDQVAPVAAMTSAPTSSTVAGTVTDATSGAAGVDVTLTPASGIGETITLAATLDCRSASLASYTSGARTSDICTWSVDAPIGVWQVSTDSVDRAGNLDAARPHGLVIAAG